MTVKPGFWWPGDRSGGCGGLPRNASECLGMGAGSSRESLPEPACAEPFQPLGAPAGPCRVVGIARFCKHPGPYSPSLWGFLFEDFWCRGTPRNASERLGLRMGFGVDVPRFFGVGEFLCQISPNLPAAAEIFRNFDFFQLLPNTIQCALLRFGRPPFVKSVGFSAL